MALLLLVSTTSWKVEKHYCMDVLIDVAFFTPAENCGMNLTSDGATPTDLGKQSCCDDEVIAVQGLDNVKPSGDDFDLQQQLFLFSFSYSYLGLFQDVKSENIPHKDYSPPRLVKDIQLLDDVFII
ncbi:hypothetical protein KO500_03365 [Cellulophaga baltica]|nr:hypothetical protein [Cellulophaga baltica]